MAPYPSSSSSSSSAVAAAAAAALASSERNRRDGRNPPPEGHAVYLQQLYREAAPRRLFVSRELLFSWRTLIWGFVMFVAIVSFVLLMWMLFHPTFPQLHVASATMSAVGINRTTAAAGCNITLVFTNPNRHLTTIYDRMEISLFYPSQQVLLSQDHQPLIVQPKKSRIAIETNLSFNGVDLGGNVVKAMKHDLENGSLGLGIKILAVVKYRNGKWKTKSQPMRAYCGGVSFGFTSSNKPGIFLNPYQECEVYIYTK